MPAFKAIVAAVPAVPVAVKVTGEPERLPDVAVSVLLPAVVPKVHVGAVAIPLLLVVTVLLPLRLPPPVAIANVTLVPLTGLLLVSVTRTLGATDNAVPTVALWLLPAFKAIVAAAPTVPLALNIAGMIPIALAFSVFSPEVVPSVQLPTVAMP